jgi:pyridine nucleotide-disulfide oxidoreductase family protein
VAVKRLLLAGGGHSHVFVLDALARKPAAGVEVTLVSPFDRQVYSGMLPGWIAGHYEIEQCVIPLAPLARRAGARFVQAHVARLDLANRIAFTEASEPLPFDVISIATGPVMDLDAIPGLREHAVALRPIEAMIAAWPRLVAELEARAEAGEDAATLTVIGGGAGGVELALAIAHRFNTACVPARVQLVTGKPGLLPTLNEGVRRRIARLAPARGVRVIEDDAVEITRRTVLLADGGEIASDVTIAAIGAAAAEWPRAAGLAVDERGFIAVDERLQSVSHPFVFAAGDCASIVGHPRPKSGVYAVRAGAPLARNLLRYLAGRRLARWRPQRVALYLISTGPQHAIASWDGLSTEGRWVWRWKDRIDRRFIARYAR